MLTPKHHYEAWPALPYEDFQSTGYLLHACTQMLGKLKLITPFEPHWANVPLWLTSQGLTTGIIPYGLESFSVDIDLINHQIICLTSWGKHDTFPLKTQSVSNLKLNLFAKLKALDIDVTINPKPQEIPNPILFDQDDTERHYDNNLAQAWWQILTSTYHVMQRYHARFKGITPPIGLMWGTFDIRDARYCNIPVEPKGENTGYLRRNAMDVVQVEAGWWSGNPNYPRAAFYSFTFPKPLNIEQSKIKPDTARWESTLGEFIFDYDEMRKAKNPATDLLTFFESAYNAGSMAANWDKHLIGSGIPK